MGGGIAGVLAYRAFGASFLFGMAGLLLMLALFSLFKQRTTLKLHPTTSLK
jgi:hypothetical protein